MQSWATILVVESEDLYTRFNTRFSPRRQRVVFAPTIPDARRQYSTHRPWLVVVATEEAGADVVALLQDVRGQDTKILGLYRDEAPPRVPWADRVAPRDDFDQVARAASALYLERQQASDEQTPVYGHSDPYGEVDLDDAADGDDTEESTVVDKLVADVFRIDDDPHETTEVTRRDEAAAQRFASMLAEEGSGSVSQLRVQQLPEVRRGADERLGQLQQRVVVLDHQLRSLQDLRQQTREGREELTRLIEAVQQSGEGLEEQVAQQAAQVAELSQTLDTLAKKLPEQALEQTLEELEQTREEREQTRIRLAQTQKELRRIQQAHGELNKQLGAVQESSAKLSSQLQQQAAQMATLGRALEESRRQGQQQQQEKRQLEGDTQAQASELGRRLEQLGSELQAQLQQQAAHVAALGRELEEGRRREQEEKRKLESDAQSQAATLDERLEQLGSELLSRLEHQAAQLSLLGRELEQSKQRGQREQQELENEARAQVAALDRQLQRVGAELSGQLEQQAAQVVALAKELEERGRHSQEEKQQLQGETQAQVAALDRRLHRVGGELRALLDRHQTKVEEVGQRLESFARDKVIEQIRRELEQAREDRDRIRQRITETQKKTSRAQNELAETFARVQEAAEQLRGQVDQQENQVAQLSMQGAPLGRVVKLEQVLSAVEAQLAQAGEKLQEQLEVTRQSTVALQGRLEDGTRLHNALHVRVNRMSMDLSEWREELKHQLGQLDDRAREAAAAFASRLESLEESKAGLPELEQLRQDLMAAREALAAADAEQLQKLDQAWKARTELDQRVAAVATLMREKAPAAEVEQTRKALQEVQEAFRHSDDELARKLDAESKRLRQQLDRARKARADLKGRVDAQAATVTTLEQARAEVVEQLTDTRHELATARETLQETDQKLLGELDQVRGQLNRELSAAQSAYADLVERVEAQSSSVAVLVEGKATTTELAAVRQELTKAREAAGQADADLVVRLEQAGAARAELEQRFEAQAALIARLEQERVTPEELAGAREALEQTDEKLFRKLDQAWRARAELEKRIEAQGAKVVAFEREKAAASDLAQVRRQLIEAQEALGKADGELADGLRLTREQLAQARQGHLALTERVDKQREALAVLEGGKAPATDLASTREELARARESLAKADRDLADRLRGADEKLERARREHAELAERVEAQAVSLAAFAEGKASSSELAQARAELAQTREELSEARTGFALADRELAEGLRRAREQLDSAARGQSELSERVEAQAGLVESKASVIELSEARAALEQADGELAEGLRAAREHQAQGHDELVRKLDQAWKARAELERQIKAQGASISALEQERATRKELSEARAALSQADEDLVRKLDQAWKARAELEKQLKALEGDKAARSELDETRASLADADTELRQALDETHSALMVADAQLRQALDDNQASLVTADDRLRQALDESHASLAAADAQTQQAVAETRTSLATTDAELRQALEELGAERLQAESRLAQKLDQQRKEHSRADQELAEGIRSSRERVEQKLEQARGELSQALDGQAALLAALEAGRATREELDQAREMQERAGARLALELTEAREGLVQADRSLLENLEETRAALERADGRLAERITTADKALEGSLLGTIGEAREALEQADGQLDAELRQTRAALEQADGQLSAELKRARMELDQQLEQARRSRVELKGRDEAQARALDALENDKATRAELGQAREGLERAGDQLKQALDHLGQQVVDVEQRRLELERRLEGQAEALAQLEREKANTRDMAQARDDLSVAREGLEESDRKLARTLNEIREQLQLTTDEARTEVRHTADDTRTRLEQVAQETQTQLEQRLSQMRTELTTSNAALASSLERKLKQGRTVQQEADQRQAQALRLVSERLEKVAKREPLALHLLLFGVAPLLVAIIGVGVYFLLRSPDQPEPGPAPPPTRAARAAKMPASRAVAPTPRLPARPDAGAPAPEPDATASARPAPLPTHVVEPEPDPKWRGKLSRRQRRAKWALRRKLLRRAGRRLRGKRYTEAKELLTQALAMADGVRVRQLLATTHERTGQLDAAAYHMGKALERSPKRIKPYLHDRLGTIQIRLNQKEHACASFREALRLKPTLPRVKFHLKRHCR